MKNGINLLTYSLFYSIAQEPSVIMQVNKTAHINRPQILTGGTINNPISNFFTNASRTCDSWRIHACSHKIVINLNKSIKLFTLLINKQMKFNAIKTKRVKQNVWKLIKWQKKKRKRFVLNNENWGFQVTVRRT